MYAVILAGGGGTRLWPLSDPRHPKPFLPLFADGSLLQKTIARLLGGPELGLGLNDIHVVTDRRYEALVRDQSDVGVLSEPVGRNTSAAIALAAVSLERDPDEVMVVLPADHLIANEGMFRGVIADAERELALGAFGIASPLVTLGIKPTGPATQYGYLVPDESRTQKRSLQSYVLEAFVEKPEPARALQLLERGAVCWNAGIFMARRSAWLAAFDRYTALLGPLSDALDSGSALEAAYGKMEAVSIDYAVMQPAAADGQVVMAGMDAGWSDVGTWAALLDAIVGGYAGSARVVPPGETAILTGDDLAVIRSANDTLRLEDGPLEVASEQPLACLPDARQHRAALTELIGRVNKAAQALTEASA
jgi:mannose-1-phosphate guanylyltransferase